MRIVLGYDGSEHSRRALERAVEYARDGSELRVIEVVDVPPQTGGHAPEPTGPEETAEVESELDAAIASLSEQRITAEAVKSYGNPAKAIIDEAQESGADLIIVGTHGRNALERVLLGSVSTKVVQNAHCDVLVVR